MSNCAKSGEYNGFVAYFWSQMEVYEMVRFIIPVAFNRISHENPLGCTVDYQTVPP